ncbi:MAG: SDR family oxidoreductase [Planctomycetaceae bacterium]
MPQTDRPVILVTGASQGLGAAISQRLAEWAVVYGGSRSGAAPDGVRRIQMDVGDEESISSAVNQIIASESRVDVLINNAGIVLSGASERTPISSVSRLIDVNFLGAMRTTHTLLPQMREQRSGLILNISSMAAAVPLPFRSCYAASKAALEAWAWSLRLEVKSFGICVSCVQVGDCQTNLSDHELSELPDHDQGVYRDVEQSTHARYRRDEANGMKPDRLAESVERIVKKPFSRIRFRHAAGPLTQRILFAFRHVLPEWAAELIIRQMYMSGR